MISLPECNLCPECQQGKHINCDGTAWDERHDCIGTCDCHVCGGGR